MSNDEVIRILLAMKDGLIHVFDHDRKMALDMAISALQNSPTQMSGTSDLISRRAVELALIEKGQASKRYKLGEFWELNGEEIREALASVPSAQPEIIYCKDCKHFVRDDIEEQMPYGFYNTYFRAFCDKHWDKEQGEYIDVCLDDHCSFAERRTDEQTD